MVLCGVVFVLASVVSVIGPHPAEETAFSPPNFVPFMELSYLDPSSGERISCGEDCRRLEVPAGIELELRIRVQNHGGSLDGEGVSWDLWFDQRKHPFPGLDIAPCLDTEEDRLDLECWSALLERVDWDHWQGLSADRVCVPSGPNDCSDVIIRVPMDAGFDGARGRGVYSFAVWVDRFRATTETDEFDNFVGPVRVKVVPPAAAREVAAPAPQAQGLSQHTVESPSGSEVLVSATSPRPYTVVVLPERTESGFSLSSQRSRGTVEFVPQYAGEVIVEVAQADAFESVIVELRKLSTGEVLAHARARGRIQLSGKLGVAHLKDDRGFAVVVRLDQGARGTRGTITVSYPARAIYRRTE